VYTDLIMAEIRQAIDKLGGSVETIHASTPDGDDYGTGREHGEDDQSTLQ
jgi:hypothetical protein